MNLSARLSRMERATDLHDPFAALTDDELESAIATLDARICQATGMAPSDYARQLANTGIPDNIEPLAARAFICSFKTATARGAVR